MVIVLMGPSCTGKSTVASELSQATGAVVYTGKDYLRLARSEPEAWAKFVAEITSRGSESPVVYVTTDRRDAERLRGLNDTIFVRCTANLDTMKKRFAQRMNGQLPPPVAQMLERQSKDWEDVQADLYLDTTEPSPKENADRILSLIRPSS